MVGPIRTYQGEIFDQIEIYRDHIIVKSKDGEEVKLSIREMEWPAQMKMCPYVDCRYYAHIPDIGNCLLNLDGNYTLDEIGVILGGISRERVRQLIDGNGGEGHHRQPGALQKFTKRFKAITKAKSLRDVMIMPDPPAMRSARSQNSVKQLRGQ